MVCLETAEERRMLPKTEMALVKSRYIHNRVGVCHANVDV